MTFQDFSHPTASTRCAKSVDRFCEDFGISRSTLYEQVRRGRLRITKLGKKSIILAEDEAAWVALLRSESDVAEPVRVGRRNRAA